MENLLALKEAIFTRGDPAEAVERCYSDFLGIFDPQHAAIFMGLLEMLEQTPRVGEILRVLDYVRFPVKKALGVDSKFV